MSKFSEENVNNTFGIIQKNFKEDDVKKVIEKEDDIKSKFENVDKLSQYFDELLLLFSMIKDYYNKKYTNVPWYIISGIGATLLYVLSPIDLIPDFIPLVGFADDAAVVAFCLMQIRSEVRKYKEWKDSNP